MDYKVFTVEKCVNGVHKFKQVVYIIYERWQKIQKRTKTTLDDALRRLQFQFRKKESTIRKAGVRKTKIATSKETSCRMY